ncbi:hypothetical protein ACFX19_035174 [Malus domestica]
MFADHESLKHINSQEKLSARHAKWAVYLQEFTFVLKHKVDVQNQVANALCRRKYLLGSMRIQVLGFDSLKDLLKTDPFFSTIVEDVEDGTRTDHVLHERFLFKENQLCILESSLRLRIIQDLHNEGHVGRDKTFELVSFS